ncbi:MAG: glycosyltransferase family 4 protein [Candidatus Bathyarchaeum tardum]|nr:MAG: glycosyltransferase family 4 protein [Candidatus Bathyarchaeum tardum]
MSAGLYDVGGFSTVMEKLAGALAKKGHDVTIGALFFKSPPSEGAYNVEKIPLGNILKLTRFLEKFDVIHNHHAITNYLALISRRPFIYHYHGAPASGKGFFHRISLLSSIKLTNHRIDAVIAVSKVACIDFKQHFGLNKMHVIYNGVDTAIFKPKLEEKFRKGTPQFLFVGNLYRHKNVEELIIAFKTVLKEHPKACLQVIGNGIMYESLKNFTAKLGLENHVDLVGRVSPLNLPYYYASCDVYVTASRWELFGLPLLEAMACGKPIVASSIPSHLELLTQSNAGETYPLTNVPSLYSKMMQTYEDRKNYENKAISFAKEHDWLVVVDNLLKIYDNLVQLQ